MNSVGHSYLQHHVHDSWDAIVIGSGIGGLAAAALLALHAGKRVLVLERHYVAGGFTHVFHRPGYEWDVGVHYIGEVHRPNSEVRAAFDEITGGRLAWQPMPDIYDRVRIAGRQYEFPSGADRLRERLKTYFPREAGAIDRYLQAVRASNEASRWYFAEKALPSLLAAAAGGLMRRNFLKYAGRTTAETLRDFTRDAELTSVLTAQWPDYGLTPAHSSFAIHSIVAGHYLAGAAYPIGGASQIAASIAPVIEDAGGEILVSADVSSIALDTDGRATGVRMADGREFRAPLVISDAGAFNTYTRLLPTGVSQGLNVVTRVRNLPASLGHVSLYVGLKDAVSLDGTNLWIYPDADHDANLARSICDPEAPFPAVFISFPSAKDPDFARRHPGHSTIEVVAPAPFSWFENWAGTRWKRRGSDYDAFKERLASRLLAELELQVPQVRGHIDYTEVSTPVTTRHFTNYTSGESYGLRAVPERFRMRALGARTPVRNLFLTGQDVSALGVTGAMMGGFLTASAVLRRNLMPTAAKAD